MTLTLIVLGLVSLLELLLYIPPLWQLRRVVATTCLLTVSAASGALFVEQPTITVGLLVIASIFRIFNLLRLIEGRMHGQYLHRVCLRTSVWLLWFQASLLGILAVAAVLKPAPKTWWLSIACVQLLVALAVLTTTNRHSRAARLVLADKHYADRDLPSISVCIPARNETLALEDSLRTLLKTTYPKLEILVLDDQSHDRTPDIIRAFAHDGVRFIKGKTPPNAWLAKNWAYQRLYEESSGEYIVFCGVDIRFEPRTLQLMIETIVANQQQMVSFIPRNLPPANARQQLSLLLQPMRYAWELCLPRRLGNRPPVLSSCWVAQRQLLARAGGFVAVSRSISPESHFAKAAGSGYRFVQSNDLLAITSLKDLANQWDTALRTRYPQLHRRPELVLLASLLELASLVLPIALVIGALVCGQWLLLASSLVTTGLLTLGYSHIVTSTYQRFQWLSLLALPFASLVDIYVRLVSMWRYEFAEVIWKGRDVTTPVMHVIPRLPPLR